MPLEYKFVLFAVILWPGKVESQNQPETLKPKPGSYLAFGQPRIEDNSMLLEEAFNQEKGFVQHIASVMWPNKEGKSFIFSYTEEIPLYKDRHQLSFNLTYPLVGDRVKHSGFGDTMLSYRYMIMDKYDWVLLIPRASIVIPTGNDKLALGDGSWGVEVGVALTKRLTRTITNHINVSYLHLFEADRYFSEPGAIPNHYERSLATRKLGVSLVYSPLQPFNLLMEFQNVSYMDIDVNGHTYSGSVNVLNPAIRFAFDIGSMQVVPGVGLPMSFLERGPVEVGTFLYLSFEPDHTK